MLAKRLESGICENDLKKKSRWFQDQKLFFFE